MLSFPFFEKISGTGASSSVAVASSSSSMDLFFPCAFEDPAVAGISLLDLLTSVSLVAVPAAGMRKFRIRLKRQGDDHTWVESVDSFRLILFYGGRLGKEHWPFKQEAFVRGRMTFSPALKNLDLSGGRTEGVASNPIRLLVPDRVVF